MFIIGLYHHVLIPLPHKIQICTYGQNQINHIKGFRTLGVGNGFPTGRQPLLSDRCRAVLLKSTGLSSKAIEQDRQSVSKAREAWQKATGKEASDLTFKRFLSALAQDISE